MDPQFIIGNLAAVLTSISFLPQAIKVIKTRDTHSISLPMYLMFVSGVMLWLIYGLLIWSIPLILANTVTVTFSGIILFYKIRESFGGSKSEDLDH